MLAQPVELTCYPQILRVLTWWHWKGCSPSRSVACEGSLEQPDAFVGLYPDRRLSSVLLACQTTDPLESLDSRRCAAHLASASWCPQSLDMRHFEHHHVAHRLSVQARAAHIALRSVREWLNACKNHGRPLPGHIVFDVFLEEDHRRHMRIPHSAVPRSPLCPRVPRVRVC